VKATILLVEDEADAGELLRDLLELEGYRVLLAYDGAQGLALAVAERPDLVVTDVMMPRMDGLELIERLRRNPDTRRTPIVVLSAFDGVVHEPSLVKPVQIPALLAVIERQLRDR